MFNPQQFGQFMQNPIQFLVARKYNVPQDLSNDPQKIVQHLMNTGQMSQSTYNELDNWRKQFEGKLKEIRK